MPLFNNEVEAAEQAAKAAEKRLLEMRLVLEENMKRAEAYRKKAEDALRWLEAQAQTNI
jgi:hypothetical protein